MPSSNLTSQPDWLETFTDGVTVAYGFDENGMWFSGDAGAPYPVRTNYDIAESTLAEIVFTFVYNDGCADHGVCVFNKDNEPYWNWGTDSSRIAYEFDCGSPYLAGQNNETGGEGNPYTLTVGNTYTGKLVYDPGVGAVTAYLYEGTSATGEPVNTLTINETLPPGAYRVGFSADQDNEDFRSYFTYAEVTDSTPQITRVFRALHFPHRRREVVSEEDGTPVNVQPGEMLYDEDSNTLYAGLADTSAIEITGGAAANTIVSNVTGIADASTILNIVKLSQIAYDNLTSKDSHTLYVIDNT